MESKGSDPTDAFRSLSSYSLLVYSDLPASQTDLTPITSSISLSLHLLVLFLPFLLLLHILLLLLLMQIPLLPHHPILHSTNLQDLQTAEPVRQALNHRPQPHLILCRNPFLNHRLDIWVPRNQSPVLIQKALCICVRLSVMEMLHEVWVHELLRTLELAAVEEGVDEVVDYDLSVANAAAVAVASGVAHDDGGCWA